MRMTSRIRDLREIDANLLVACDALLETASVTEAARKMRITQSAMSQTLARLRVALQDPLLVRRGGRMTRTPYAEELGPPLHEALRALLAAVGAQTRFEPATAQRRFVISTSDAVAATLVPGLHAIMRRETPGCALDVRQRASASAERMLLEGELDAFVGVPPGTEPNLVLDELYREGYWSLVRRSNPYLKGPNTARRFAAAEHVVVSTGTPTKSVVDVALAEHGLTRRIVAHVGYFLAVAPLVRASDVVVTLPERAAHLIQRTHGLRGFAPPLGLPQIAIAVAVHRRFSADPAVQWLRQALRRASGLVRRE